jgi:hypothetical protein
MGFFIELPAPMQSFLITQVQREVDNAPRSCGCTFPMRQYTHDFLAANPVFNDALMRFAPNPAALTKAEAARAAHFYAYNGANSYAERVWLAGAGAVHDTRPEGPVLRRYFDQGAQPVYGD